jgi:DNA-binding LytR/AlgR family response regulator
MSQRYILCLDGASTKAEDRDKVTRFLESHGWQVWHWFEDLWMVTIPGDEMNMMSMRDEIRVNALPKGRFVIFELAEGSRTGGTEQTNAVEWIYKNWLPEELKP